MQQPDPREVRNAMLNHNYSTAVFVASGSHEDYACQYELVVYQLNKGGVNVSLCHLMLAGSGILPALLEKAEKQAESEPMKGVFMFSEALSLDDIFVKSSAGEMTITGMEELGLS